MEEKNPTAEKTWYDKYYKILLSIPVIILIFCLVYLIIFYQQTGDIILKDTSLSGGTAITLTGDIDSEKLVSELSAEGFEVNLRKLTDFATGKQLAVIVESSEKPEIIKPKIEEILGYTLTNENSTIEFTGSTLSSSFYKQLIFALIASFILMSLVVFFMFKTFIPGIAIIFAAFSDIVMPLAVLDYLGIKISAAGIAAFLMIIGYSVDDNVLLTTRALKKKELVLNARIYSAFKTGIFMTLTALLSVLPAFFIVTGLPDSFRQIFLILALGLTADIFNTWMTNAGILKWYVDRKEKKVAGASNIK